MFDKKTIEILNNFATINKSILIDGGSLRLTSKDDTNALAGEYTLDVPFDSTIGIYDLSTFLAALKTFENPAINIKSEEGIAQYITIEEEGRKLVFYCSNPRVINQKNQTCKFPEPTFTVELSHYNLNQIKKMSSMLGLSDLQISPNGFKILDKNIDNFFEIKLSEEASLESDKVGTIALKYLRIIPDSYKVDVYVDQSGFGLTRFTSLNGENELKYYIVLNSK